MMAIVCENSVPLTRREGDLIWVSPPTSPSLFGSESFFTSQP